MRYVIRYRESYRPSCGNYAEYSLIVKSEDRLMLSFGQRWFESNGEKEYGLLNRG